MARRGGDRSERGGERRDSQPDRDQFQDGDLGEPERESVAALKAILTRVATVVKPLGLTPQEATDLVQRMYDNTLALDTKLAGEPDDRRRTLLLDHIQNAEIRREDDVLVVDYPA